MYQLARFLYAKRSYGMLEVYSESGHGILWYRLIRSIQSGQSARDPVPRAVSAAVTRTAGKSRFTTS